MPTKRATLSFLAAILLALRWAAPQAAEIGRMQNEDTDLDSEPSAMQQRLIDQRTAAQVSDIDKALLHNCTAQWRKVARVAGTTMLQFNGKFTGIPDVFFAKRVAAIVAEGKLEAQGNLRRMRFSEVRLRTP